MQKVQISEEKLREILELAKSATPTPWFVRQLDDDHSASLVAISTKRDTGKNEHWPDFDCKEIIAATIVQHPRYVSIGDEKWDENAEYIVAAATVLPLIIEELLELRKLLDRH